MIERETQNRLRRRAEESDETYDDVIDRLLDKTTVEVDLEELIHTAKEQYENVPQVAIKHCSHVNPVELVVIVWGATRLEEELEITPEGATVVINRDDETLRLPVRAQGRAYLPPSRDTQNRTTVYMDNDEESVDVESGVHYFKEKLRNPEVWERNHSGNAFELLQIQ